MAQLSSVIGSILRDIISAQHEANLYSLSLSESYGKDGKTKDFQLPNVMISDMEMDLKYGVLSTSENQEQYNIKYTKFRQFVKEVCEEAAKEAIDSATTAILTSTIRRDEADKRFFYRLRQEDVLHRNFEKFLMRNMRKEFDTNLYESIDATTGYVNVETVTAKLMDVVRKKFINDSELEHLFADSDGKALKREAEQAAQTTLADYVKQAADGKSFKRVKTFPQLDVAVTADELASMPADAIHSFKFKFTPTTCTISAMEDNDELEDFVMNG